MGQSKREHSKYREELETSYDKETVRHIINEVVELRAENEKLKEKINKLWFNYRNAYKELTGREISEKIPENYGN